MRIILRTLGVLLIGEAFFMLIAATIGFLFRETEAWQILYSAFICWGIGGLSFVWGKQGRKEIGKHEGIVIIVATWIIPVLAGTLPYLLTRSITSFTDAFFEAMSGFTTTGSSVIPNVEQLSHGILLWRSLTQWLGGLWILILCHAALPVLGGTGMLVLSTELPGTTSDRNNPKIHRTGRNLLLLYLALIAIETVFLNIGGMNIFDSVNHALTTLSTGGFSTKQAGINFWNSSFIQYVIVVFMLIGGTNFMIIYWALSGKIKKAIQNEEFHFYLLFVVLFSVAVFAGLMLNSAIKWTDAIRTALFQVVSIISTTGFYTTNYMQWAPILVVLIIALFFFGGSTGSTAGGVKIMRVILLMKNSNAELRRATHPNAIISSKFNRHAISEQSTTNVLVFFMVYAIIFFFSTLAFTLIQPDITSSISLVASCLGNIGPGLGKFGTTENLYALSGIGKWFLAFLMLLGRLEFFAVLTLFTLAFWKK